MSDLLRASLKYGLLGGERNTIKQYIASRQALMGDTLYALDTEYIAQYVLYTLRERRGFNPRASAQHNAAVLATESRYGQLQELDIPTLVLHGRSDPFIPIEHGQKCAAIIPGAEAVWVDGMGHDVPDAYNDIVVDSILANLERSSASAVCLLILIRPAGVNPLQDRIQIAPLHPVNYPLPELKTNIAGHQVRAIESINIGFRYQLCVSQLSRCSIPF